MTNFFPHKKILVQAAILSGCLFFSGCENDPKTLDEWTRNELMVEEARQVETFISQDGKMRAKLWAPYMLRYQKDTVFIEFPQTLKVNFFDSTGKVESHLDALYGIYYENLNKVFLRDSVVVFNVQGDTLRCPELWWDQTTQRFFTDKPVRVRKSGNLIFGNNGLEARQDLSDINIRQIKGTILVPDSLSAQ